MKEVRMARHRVALLDPFPPEVLVEVEAALPESLELLAVGAYSERDRLDAIATADFLLVGAAPVPAHLMDAAPRLKLIHKWGTGYDKIDVKAAAERGILVAITTGANTIPVAEHSVMLMLAVFRKLPYIDRRLRQGRWSKTEIPGFPHQLNGKTVGLVGLGHIGREVARLVRAFDTRALYYRRHRDVEAERQLGVEFRPLEELLAQADVVSLHVPLTPETRKLIDGRAISLMKPTTILVNTSRGGVIDEPALVQALRSGRLMGAGLDVFAVEPPGPGNPLLELDNVVVTNHCAGNSIENVGNIARHAFGNMLRVAKSEPVDEADVVRP